MRGRGLVVLVAAAAIVGGGGAARADTVPGFFQLSPSIRVTAGTALPLAAIAVTDHEPTTNASEPPLIHWGDEPDAVPPQALIVDRDAPDCDSLGRCPLIGSHVYGRPGTYQALVRYRASDGGLHDGGFTVTVDPVGFRIVSVGDSVASGEGNPDVPKGSTRPALWDDGTGGLLGTSTCHRAAQNAGAGLAARELEGMNGPLGVHVGYMNVACTGNATQKVIEQVMHLPPGHIDALVVSSGADDLAGDFANFVASCLGNFLPGCDSPTACTFPRVLGVFAPCSGLDALHNRIGSDLSSLGAKFTALADAIASHPGGVGHVYATEYFDPTHDGPLGAPNTYGDSTSNLLCTGDTFTAAEKEWSYNAVVRPLNDQVHRAADAHGWVYVGGISDAFAGHGICGWRNGSNWVVSFGSSITDLTSFDLQGDQKGTGHPNPRGQLVYRDALVGAITQFTTPVTTAVATVGDTPYTSGARAAGPVLFHLTAAQPLPTAGLGQTYHGVDSSCSPTNTGACSTDTDFTVDADAVHVVTYFSTNAHGVAEAPQRFVVAPEVTAAAPTALAFVDAHPFDLAGWATRDVTIELVAAKGGKEIHYGLDGTCTPADLNCPTYTGPIVVSGDGSHVLKFYAEIPDGAPSAVQSVTVQIDGTPPSVSCDAADGAWHADNVDRTCTVTDATSGVVGASGVSGDQTASLTTSVPPGEETADAATGAQPFCDAAGNCTFAGPLGGNMVDRAAPEIECESVDAAWHAANVSVSCTASDGGSGLASGASPFTLQTSVSPGSETADAATNSSSVCDGVGNCSSAGPVTGIHVDRKAPVTAVSASGGIEGAWSRGPVTVSLHAADGGSGVAQLVYVTGGGSAPTTVSGSDATLTFATDGVYHLSYHAVDAAGNAEQERVLTVRVDATPPRIVCTASPSTIWPPNKALVPVAVTVKVSDATSGPNGFSLVSTDTSEGDAVADIRGWSIGTADTEGTLRADRLGSGPGRIYTLVYRAADEAGNTASCRVAVTVPHDQRH